MADQPKSFNLSPEIHEYLVARGTPPDEVQRWLIGETKSRVGDFAGMQIAPEQGAFMTLLTRLLDARSAVEVGTFTGYSSLCIARGLAPGGRLIGHQRRRYDDAGRRREIRRAERERRRSNTR